MYATAALLPPVSTRIYKSNNRMCTSNAYQTTVASLHVCVVTEKELYRLHNPRAPFESESSDSIFFVQNNNINTSFIIINLLNRCECSGRPRFSRYDQAITLYDLPLLNWIIKIVFPCIEQKKDDYKLCYGKCVVKEGQFNFLWNSLLYVSVGVCVRANIYFSRSCWWIRQFADRFIRLPVYYFAMWVLFSIYEFYLYQASYTSSKLWHTIYIF